MQEQEISRLDCVVHRTANALITVSVAYVKVICSIMQMAALMMVCTPPRWPTPPSMPPHPGVTSLIKSPGTTVDTNPVPMGLALVSIFFFCFHTEPNRTGSSTTVQIPSFINSLPSTALTPPSPMGQWNVCKCFSSAGIAWKQQILASSVNETVLLSFRLVRLLQVDEVYKKNPAVRPRAQWALQEPKSEQRLVAKMLQLFSIIQT